MPIPVIDLFAGPGGLGEGFSALRRDGEPAFKIKLSIEKDPFAHRTLELRAFYRQFPHGRAPEDYYDYLFGVISRDQLFAKFPEQAQRASIEAWHAELGGVDFPNDLIDERIDSALGSPINWVLIGGPPCQAYSLMGRAKLIGEFGRETYEADARHFLFREYLRIIARHQPPFFVMENVKGLLTAKRNEEGIFHKILEDLKHPLDAIYGPPPNRKETSLTYRLVSLVVRNGALPGVHEPEDYLVCSENYGIPQARHRIIILGMNAEDEANARLLQPKSPVPIEDVISDLPPLRSGLSREPDSANAWRQALLTIPESAWFASPKVTDAQRCEIRRQLRELNGNLPRGSEIVPATRRTVRAYAEWFTDDRLAAVCNHATRLHIREDLHRYFFVSTFAAVHGRSPLLADFPPQLLPNHKNVAQALRDGKFNDRFRVQILGRPSTTITSHISKDGHYFIHYDPGQCRSLTVREAARLQTFPDNYFFEGPRTQQYQQVGNAVPPLLARQIADIVAELIP